ncbi:type I restriction enzyme S subunit [Natrinema hispanicum]|uniref:Type I restriction enzyme S subunit n=1 Tax=Natrinema hispanicum TaxID=392421 RepID=A0A482Y5J9_9EURY|nr:restriction endonuclease subunit S [Natrinema hispanicum]RZV08760.1 type I restriction enzyme S subunit [Natrinema hispanicum]
MSEIVQEFSDIPKGYNKVQLGPKSEVVPSEWRIESLSSWLSSLETGGRPKTSERSESDSVLSIGGAHISGGSFDLDEPVRISEDYYDGLKSGKIEEDDILLVKDGATIGKSTYVNSVPEERAAVNSHVYIIRVDDEKYDPRFLYNFVNSRIGLDQILRLTTGTAQAGLNRTFQQAVKVPTPPLREQRRIADILSTVDDQIQQTDDIISKTRELKRGLIQDLIFFGKDHSGTQSVQLGPVTTEIAEAWNVATVGEVTTKAQYGTSESLSTEGKYPVFRMNNIEDGKMVSSPMKYSDLEEDQAKKYRVEQGDILFNRTNSIDLVGKSGIFDLEGEYVFASYLICLRTNEKMNPYFLNYYLNSHIGQGILFSIATRGASQANINATNLKNVKVPLPPREQQDQIVDKIQKVEEKIEQEQKTKEKFQELKRGLMQDLLTGKVRVNIAD